MLRHAVIVLCLSLVLLATLAATRPTTAPATTPALKPVPLLTPEQEIATFQLAPGLRVEIVAAEPMVEHPVFVTFDADGRMWVAEMRGYMPNVIGWGEEKPTGRVSVLEDTDGDGRMDRKTVFLDKLVLPRAIGFVKDGVLIGAPPNLLLCRDLDGDLKSDEQRVIDANFAVVNNPENFANGLLHHLDNWIYNADHDKRLRVRDGKVVMSKIPILGQWGITRDDYGRLFFNTNSDYLRGSLVPPHYSTRNPRSPIALADVRIAKDQSVWPLHAATINRGYRPDFIQPDGKLKEFTAACSPHIYRGDLFKDFYGNAFVCEATSNFVRRAVITEKDGILAAEAADRGKEFLASTYERFRPVNLQTGPEGALYVVDMHHGLIQHRISITEHAKDQYTKKNLHKHLLTGRIFRIVPERGAPPARPQLSKATSEQLVRQLTHPNGWWRDTAQRLLVERGDEAAVEPLKKLAREGASPVHRINALWALEGMDRLNVASVETALNDPDPKVVVSAIRLSESVPAAQSAVIGLQAEHPEVRRQHVLTLAGLAQPHADGVIGAYLAVADAHVRDAAVSGLARREIAFLRHLVNDANWKDSTPARRAAITAITRSVVRREDAREMLELVNLVADTAPNGSDASLEKHWHQLAMLDAIPAPQRDEYGTAKVIHVATKPPAVDQLNVAKVAALFQWPGKPMPPRPKVEPLTAEQERLFEIGRQQFALVCAACHQKDGIGQEGKAPPLVNSPWVLGPQSRLIRIVLHGMKGPITLGGKEFNGDMPSWKAMTDEQIAGVLTYIRREWGHEAPAIDVSTVHGIRDWTQARRDGWTESELLGLK